MNLEEQIRLHKEISLKIEDLEKQKKILGESIMQQMPGKALQVPGFLVKRFSRLSISISTEQARELNALILKETIDRDAIKRLYNTGLRIPGVSECHYIQISRTP